MTVYCRFRTEKQAHPIGVLENFNMEKNMNHKLNWLLIAAALWLGTAMSETYAQEEAIPSLVPAERMDKEWWSARHEANKKRIAEGNVDLLMIGDSITHRWDTMGEEVEKYYYGDRNCVNMGFDGDHTQHVLWRLADAPMDKIHPKAAMLLIGANNICVDRPNIAEETALGIQACVDKLQTLYPDIKILLLSIFPTGEAPDFPMRKVLADVNRLLPGIFFREQYKNVTLMNMDYLWLGAEDHIPQYLMWDHDHPSKLGYKLWGAEVEATLAKMLGVEPKKAME